MGLGKLRRKISERSAGGDESGFTLVELLVVMLILGILAAIAIPAFFNQKQKANDSQAKAMAHSAQIAIEAFSTDNSGSYATATPSALLAIEPTLTIAASPNRPYLSAATVSTNGYTLTVTSPTSGDTFSVMRAPGGAITFPCTASGNGGCPPAGTWGS